MFRTTVYFCLLTTGFGQVIRDGTCDWDNILSVTNLNITGLADHRVCEPVQMKVQTSPNPTAAVGHLDRIKEINKMLGQWYQLQRVDNTAETGHCSTVDIEINSTSANPVTISNREIHNKHAHIRRGYIVGTNETLGLYRIQYENTSYDTVVMATDYIKYAMLYSCMPSSDENKSLVYAWLYSRTTSLSQVDTAILQALITIEQELRNATWVETKHTEDACNTSGGAISFRLSSVLALLAALIFGKSFIA